MSRMAGSKTTGFILLLYVLSHLGNGQNNDESHFLRTKRGLGSLLGKAILTGVKAAYVSNRMQVQNTKQRPKDPPRMSSPTLTEALNDPSFSDNCPNFPSLCENKQEILKLMQQAVENRKQLVKEQNVNMMNVTALEKINANNHHILHKINQTEAVLLQVINNSRSTDLELFRHIQKYLQTSNVSKLNFSVFVDRIIEPLEYRFSDLKRILNGRKLTPPELIALQNMAETSVKSLIYTMSRFYAANLTTQMEMDNADLSQFLIKSFGKNMSMTLADVEILKNNSHPRHQTVAVKYGLHSPKYKLAWKLVQKIANKGWHLSELTVLMQANIWKLEEFKSSLKLNMGTDLLKIKRKYHETNWKLKHSSESFKFTYRKSDWDVLTRNDIDNITATVVSAIRGNHWSVVAAKIEEIKIQYNTYIKQISNELHEVYDERKSFPNLVKECSQQYHDTKKIFFDVLYSDMMKAFMAEVLGLQISASHSSDTSYPDNLAEKGVSNFGQEQLSRIISHTKHGLDRLRAWTNAQLIVFDYVGKATEKKERVSRMHETLQSVFAFQSVQVKEFGHGIDIANLLCTVALIRRDLDYYDSFSLASIRGSCFSHNVTAFTNQALTEYKKVLMEIKISEEVKSGKTGDVSAITDAVINMFVTHSDVRLWSEGSSISDKDVLCLIAKLFPRKDTYGFYNLYHFRPDCKRLSTETFLKLKMKALKKRIKLEGDIYENKLCNTNSSCPDLKENNNLNEKRVPTYLENVSKSYNAGTCLRPFCIFETMIAILIFLKF